MEASQLLQTLLDISVQACHLARLIRDDKELFDLLVASKDVRVLDGSPDFKTLADVLIQSTFKYRIGKQFPGHRISIRGEEDGTFPSLNGGKIDLKITDDIDNTRRLLSCVLKNVNVIDKLSEGVHRSISVRDDLVRQCDGILLPEDLDIWIDPIDSTKGYITGGTSLESVTVLVGVHYNSVPIMGVMSYPFNKEQIWGLAYEDKRICNLPKPRITSPIKNIVLSGVESNKCKDQLLSAGYQIEAVQGAGHKLGCVISGKASFFFTSRTGTFQWDTCGPHAILRAMSGDILTLAPGPNGRLRLGESLKYNDSTGPNSGFIAYVDGREMEKLKGKLNL
eukprot:sb/3466510/